MSALQLCRGGGGGCVCCGNITAAQRSSSCMCNPPHTAPETSPAAHLLSAFSISIAKLLLLPLLSPSPSLPLSGTINYSPIYLFPVWFLVSPVCCCFAMLDRSRTGCVFDARTVWATCLRLHSRLLSWLSEVMWRTFDVDFEPIEVSLKSKKCRGRHKNANCVLYATLYLYWLIEII